MVADLSINGQKYVAVNGGMGGVGNRGFATPTCQLPRISSEGTEGDDKIFELELKTIADIGLVSFCISVILRISITCNYIYTLYACFQSDGN